jgi:pyrroline-5-carboxylate reductase
MLKKLLDKNLQLTIIGGGNMSQALIAGLIKSKTFDSRQITIGEKDQEKLISLKLKYEINTSKNNLEAIQKSDITILAVKPQDFPRVSSEIKPTDFSHKILISVLAGTTLSTLKSSLNLTKVVRVMPNTPCLIQQGMSAWHSENLSEDENYTVRKML